MNRSTLLLILGTYLFYRYSDYLWNRWILFCHSFAKWVQGQPLSQWFYMWIAYTVMSKLNSTGVVEWRKFEGKTFCHLRVKEWENPLE